MILGVFSKGSRLDTSTVDSSLSAFSLAGQRPLKPFARDRFVAAIGGASVEHAESGDRLAIAFGHALAGVGVAKSLVGDDGLSSPPGDAAGSHVFARYDAAKHELVLGNDAFGFQPLFVVETDELVAFCTEYEPLLELPGVGRSLDADAVAQYYTFGMTLGERTFFSDVALLPPGTLRTVTASGASDRRHDELAVPLTKNASLEEHAKVVGAALQRAVRRGLDAHPNGEAGLTGGADTRLILSCMTPEQRQRHSFVTHYAEKGAADRDRDVVIARLVAEKAGLKHEAIFLEHGHQPFEPSVYGEHRRKGGKEEIFHSGVLGGELLGGCCVDVALFPVQRVSKEAVTARIESVFTPEFIQSLAEHPYDALQHEWKSLRAENREMAFWTNAFARPFFSQLYAGSNGVRTSTWMVPWQMHQRMLTPFVDPEFLRALLAVPFEFITGYRLYNEVYRSVFPEFTDVPTNSGLAVRSDSAIPMFTVGEEPKKARLGRVVSGRALAVQRHVEVTGAPLRDIYRSDWMAEALRSELEANEKTSMVTRLKNVYTKSPLFKARHALPIHGILMRWKAKSETASAARVTLPLTPMFADFEDWCSYMDVPAAELMEA